ncbi:MAG: polyprenyl synthetase family protein [Bdellovibrionota bacterium]
MGWEAFSEERVQLISQYIDSCLDRFEQSISKQLRPMVEAMRYSIQGGGKRLRPMLMVTVAEYLGLPAKRVLPAACALEYIHTYSLIHDDLPALDDDDTRRGKPSNHKKFGEAVAILAGDALLTEAFTTMLDLRDNEFTAEQVLNCVATLSCYSGVRGMVGGQFLDVTKGAELIDSLPELEFIHIHKTGALILASVMIPTCLVETDEETKLNLRRYGKALGLAFQISDDILDSEANFRYSRGPRKKPKPNYTQLTAPGEIRDRLNGLIDSAISCIDEKKGQTLIDIAEFIRTRKS